MLVNLNKECYISDKLCLSTPHTSVYDQYTFKETIRNLIPSSNLRKMKEGHNAELLTFVVR